MATEDVERFVGLLVSDEEFVAELGRDFDLTCSDKGLDLSKKEMAILREGLTSYVRPEIATPGGSVMAVGAAVGAAVAASVATKVVDKLMNSKIAAPLNIRIRESMLHRRLLDVADFDRR